MLLPFFPLQFLPSHQSLPLPLPIPLEFNTEKVRDLVAKIEETFKKLKLETSVAQKVPPCSSYDTGSAVSNFH